MSPVLKELILGILLCGILLQFIPIWFVKDSFYYSCGLWIGIALAVFRVIHMEYGIENSMEFTVKKDMVNYSRKMYAIRTLVTVMAVFLVYRFRLGNVVAVFLGMFAVKFGAYLQPVIHGLMLKRKEKGR